MRTRTPRCKNIYDPDLIYFVARWLICVCQACKLNRKKVQDQIAFFAPLTLIRQIECSRSPSENVHLGNRTCGLCVAFI